MNANIISGLCSRITLPYQTSLTTQIQKTVEEICTNAVPPREGVVVVGVSYQNKYFMRVVSQAGDEELIFIPPPSEYLPTFQEIYEKDQQMVLFKRELFLVLQDYYKSVQYSGLPTDVIVQNLPDILRTYVSAYDVWIPKQNIPLEELFDSLPIKKDYQHLIDQIHFYHAYNQFVSE